MKLNFVAWDQRSRSTIKQTRFSAGTTARPIADEVSGGTGVTVYSGTTMLVHDLSPTDCREALKSADLGRLACVHDDQPYIVPIHFSFDAVRNCLYAFSTVGQKIEWMRENPKVCVAVEDVTDKGHWTTVLVFGRYEEMTDSPADTAALKSVSDLFQQRAEWWLPATAKLGTREHHEVVIYRIQIDQLTGRRASRDRA